MRQARSAQRRLLLAREAARLMYEEGVKQYLDAKRIAARRLWGIRGRRRLQFRPRDLPSNGEIRAELLELAARTEGSLRMQRLFAMRVIALETMRELAPFHPGLIGSVSTGHVRRGSDIDIHIFSDDLEALERHLHAKGWPYELSLVTIRNQHQMNDYTHVHLEEVFPIELSVYPCDERRKVQRSSTDGKPIRRIKPRALEELIIAEHPRVWNHYLETGELEDLHLLEDEKEMPTLADLEELD